VVGSECPREAGQRGVKGVCLALHGCGEGQEPAQQVALQEGALARLPLLYRLVAGRVRFGATEKGEHS
jgi:hypothetical protein